MLLVCVAGALILAFALTLALGLYLAATNALFTRLLQLHGALTALHRFHPAARILTFLPLKLLVAAGRYARWWLELRRSMAGTAPSRIATKWP